MTSTTKCEFCDKRGLPLLLVRDAIAPAGSGAPLAEQLPVALDAHVAHYTKRLLRTGYVNVYDEARRRWDAYFVSPDGYLFRILQTPGVATVVPTKPFNCPDEAHRAVASCITIPDPKSATKVWIAFSDVEWTTGVRKRNEDPAFRKRHMVEVDVKSALSGQRAPAVRPLAQVSATVCEYALDKPRALKEFSWGPHQFNSRYHDTVRLVKECETMLSGKALIITVPDPAGMVQELALLMKANFEKFVSNSDMKRNVAASDAIETIRSMVHVQAVNAEISAAENNAREMEAKNPLGQLLSKSTREMTAKIRVVSPAQAELAIKNSWKKYDDKFNDKAHRRWRDDFDKKIAIYDKEMIAPLAVCHATWLRSTALAEYFICNFDRSNQDSGIVYVETLRRCVMATQDKLACANVYGEWLKGDPADTKNLLMQALMLNQERIAEMVKKDLAVTLDIRQFPWDNVLAAYGMLAERGRHAVGQLLVQFVGTIIRYLGKVIDLPPKLWSGAVVLGMVTGHPIVKVEIVGTRAKFREHLVREILRNSGEPIPPGKLRRAIDIELTRQRIYGEPVEGTRKLRWVVMADNRIFSDMPTGLTPTEKAAWVTRSVISIEALERTHLNRWRAFINTDLRAGVVAAALQYACLTKLREDEGKALSNETTDATWRLNAGLAAIAGTTTEVIGNALKGVATLGMRYGQGLTLSASRIAILVGKAAGVIGGIGVAILDVRKALESYSEGQMGLAWLFGFSAFAGLGLTYAIVSGAVALPITLLLLGVVILIGVLIEYVKDNPIQDWLERCPWGEMESQRYPDLKTEQDQLALAFK